jgi:uroporphyrinogen decarboxylase
VAALSDPAGFSRLIDVLVEASVDYLVTQLRHGADAVQIFDTWSGVLDMIEFERWVVEPTARIVAGVRAAVPGARVIGFPKGAGAALPGFISRTGVNAVGLDWATPLPFARDIVQPLAAVQGNLDPLRLVVGGDQIDEAVDTILAHLSGGRFIFNLGHGITPEATPAALERVVRRVRDFRG